MNTASKLIQKKSSKIEEIFKQAHKLPKQISGRQNKRVVLRERLAARAVALYIGRTGSHINRTDKLINMLAYDGNRKRIEDAIIDLKVRIKEYFLPRSSADFLENLLTRLEPMLDFRETKSFRRKHSNRRQNVRPKSFLVVPASNSRRVQLGLGFFIKAVNLTQKKLQLTLTTAMMAEVVALCSGMKCYSMRLKRDHVFNTLRFFNRFGGPVEVGSKIANRFERKLTTPKRHKKLADNTKKFQNWSKNNIKRKFEKRTRLQRLAGSQFLLKRAINLNRVKDKSSKI